MNLPPPPPEPKLLCVKDEDGSWLSIELRHDADEGSVLDAFTSIWAFLGYTPSEIVRGE